MESFFLSETSKYLYLIHSNAPGEKATHAAIRVLRIPMRRLGRPPGSHAGGTAIAPVP